MAPPEPSPTTQTLRLKSHKTTILLHIDPLQTFASIKAELLTALRDTGLKDADTGADIVIPESLRPEDITFGRPRNVNEPGQGFVVAEWEKAKVGDGDEEDEDGLDGLDGLGDEDDDGGEEGVKGNSKAKGKGKASASASAPAKKKPGRPVKSSKATSSTNNDIDIAEDIKQCPKGANLKDGAVLAFRFPSDGTGWEERDEDEDRDELDEDTEDGEKARMWGVKIASFEDGYGVENSGDVGGGREFEG
jgi:hypothetical protein